MFFTWWHEAQLRACIWLLRRALLSRSWACVKACQYIDTGVITKVYNNYNSHCLEVILTLFPINGIYYPHIYIYMITCNIILGIYNLLVYNMPFEYHPIAAYPAISPANSRDISWTHKEKSHEVTMKSPWSTLRRRALPPASLPQWVDSLGSDLQMMRNFINDLLQNGWEP